MWSVEGKHVKCPFCKEFDTKVLESRDNDETFVTRRRRECLKCERRYTTYERIEPADLYVVKKDGKREKYSREKILKGLHKAFEKRPVTEEQVESIADEIEHAIRQDPANEISSKKIGDALSKRIKSLDKIAYIRFASVYKDFKDLEEFESELAKLTKK